MLLRNKVALCLDDFVGTAVLHVHTCITHWDVVPLISVFVFEYPIAINLQLYALHNFNITYMLKPDEGYLSYDDVVLLEIDLLASKFAFS